MSFSKAVVLRGAFRKDGKIADVVVREVSDGVLVYREQEFSIHIGPGGLAAMCELLGSEMVHKPAKVDSRTVDTLKDQIAALEFRLGAAHDAINAMRRAEPEVGEEGMVGDPAEWQPDPEFWETQGEFFVAVAKDGDGRCYAYTRIPELFEGRDCWSIDIPGIFWVVDPSTIPAYVPWQQSLRVRPGYEEGQSL